MFPTASDGRIGRVVETGEWLVPSDVRLDDDHHLHYGPARSIDGPFLAEGETRTANRSLLESFTRLRSDSDGSRVLAFAQKFGVLELCSRHDLPMSHWPARLRRFAGDEGRCRPVGGPLAEEAQWREPIRRWRELADEADAILRIGYQVASPRPRPAPFELWERVDTSTWLSFDLVRGGTSPVTQTEIMPINGGAKAAVGAQRRLLALIISGWLRVGDVRLSMSWEGQQPSLPQGGHSLFGAVAMQMAVAVTGRDALAVCSHCGLRYSPKRQPDPDKPHYCPACKHIPKREWARRQREEDN